MPFVSPRFKHVLAGAAAAPLVFFATCGHAQQGSQQPAGGAPTLHVTTRLVVLDVVVTDKKGKLVDRKLTKDDFQVVDSGVVQTIRHFETPDEHRMPDPGKAIVHSAADLARIGDAPVTIMVIDELNGRFEDMSYARQMLVKYLESQPPVLPNPAVLMVASNTTFQQIHDYTQDRDELIRAVKKHYPQVPSKANARTGPMAVERMAQVLNALQQITESTSGTPGRKNLIWVGNGFPSANFNGMPQNEADMIQSAIKRVTSRLVAARVTVYTINPTLAASSNVDIEDPNDLATAQGENGGDPFGAGNVNFTDLAPSTGGLAFTGRNDLNNLIGSGIDQGRNYYTLAYTPTAGVDPTKFRTVRVLMKDHDLRAVTRDGYYPASSADTNPVLDKTLSQKQARANLQLDLSNALTTTISYNGLGVTAETAGKGEWTIHVAENGIGWSEPAADGSMVTEATVAAGWYDAKGKLSGRVIRELTCMRGAANGATYTLPVDLPAGVARVRFVVRDARNGRMGTVDIQKP